MTPDDVLYQHFQPSRLVPSRSLGRGGVTVLLKLECELPTGSFKVRGALYSLARRLDKGSVREVVAASTGNHGAAVAWAAQRLHVPARIFLPQDSNPTKVGKITALGARITEAGTTLTEAIVAAARHAAQTGAFLLADASDADVPLGAGTIGTELLRQAPNMDVVYVPVGDTALVRGIAAAVKKVKPKVKVIGVQAAGAPAYMHSWQSGHVETTPAAQTIADGLATTHPLQPNVDAIRALVDEFRLVNDDEMIDAIARMLRDEDITIEPASAATVAAFTRDQSEEKTTGRSVVLILSGANVAPTVLAEAERRATA